MGCVEASCFEHALIMRELQEIPFNPAGAKSFIRRGSFKKRIVYSRAQGWLAWTPWKRGVQHDVMLDVDRPISARFGPY
jgi:hypothetical protein